MAADLNSVKTRYHHGSLRPALVAAAEAVIAERGLDAFSLRETARRAGVSPSAPAHHFGDARGLLTAIAASAFGDLADALAAAASASDHPGRIRAQGAAYVAFALSNRARFDLMWRAALLDRDDEAYRAAAQRAFRVLASAVMPDAPAPAPESAAAAPAIAGWALVHGFARLAIDGAFGTEPGAADRAAEAILPTVMAHLRL